MSKDAKIAIFVMFIIFSGVSFVFLTAASVRKGNREGATTVFFTESKKQSGEKKSYLDEDFKIEILDHSALESHTTKPIVTESAKKVNVAVAPINTKKPNVETVVSPTPNIDKKAPIVDEYDFLNPTSEKTSNSLEKVVVNTDTIKVEETKPIPMKIPDKVLETKTLEDTTYIVKEGDTLSIIAKAFYDDSKKHQLISDANNGLSSQNLKIGMKIRIPGTDSQKNITTIKKPLENPPMVDGDKPVIYKVKQGDTISSSVIISQWQILKKLIQAKT